MISPQDLRTFFSYDPETGDLVWIRHEGPIAGSRVGKVAGSLSDGRYLRVSVRKRAYLVHRVVWAIYYGAWPDGPIDHVNRIATDNRITNLRECTVRQNNANVTKKRRPNATSIYKGVCIRPRCKRWRAEVGGVLLGLFESEEAAARAYDLAAPKIYGEFAVLNFPNEER